MEINIFEGLKFKHFLSKDVFYIITEIRKEKILEVNSKFIVTIHDNDGEFMGTKHLTDIKKLFDRKEWLEL